MLGSKHKSPIDPKYGSCTTSVSFLVDWNNTLQSLGKEAVNIDYEKTHSDYSSSHHHQPHTKSRENTQLDN